MIGSANGQFVGVAMLILMICVLCQAVIEGGIDLYVPSPCDMYLRHRRDNKELRVALVALRVEEDGVGAGGVIVFLLITFPCVEAVVFDVKGEESELLERHTCVRLPSEATADVVVAVDEVVIVALAATKYDAVEEETLLQERQATRSRKLKDKARTEGGGLADLERIPHVGAFDAVGGIVVEMLINTPLCPEDLSFIEVMTVESSYEVDVAK